ncbi:MAG: group II truncated hemoglobin [Gaiellales bacterium]
MGARGRQFESDRPDSADRSLFAQAGGLPGLERLTTRFYERVFADPVLLPLFRDPGEQHAERLTLWLAELLGGPALHTEQRGGFEVMRGAHHGLRITGEQRKAWADHMHAAAEDVGLDEDFRRAFMPFIEGGSTFCQRVSWPRDQRLPR